MSWPFNQLTRINQGRDFISQIHTNKNNCIFLFLCHYLLFRFFLLRNGVRFNTPLVLNTIGGALSFLYSLTPILWVRCPAQLKCRIVKFGCLIKQQWAWVILSYFIWCCPADWLQIWTWCLYLSVNIRIKIFVLSVISVLYLQDIATLRLQQWSCCMETVIMFALMLCPWHMRETSANLMLGGLWPHDQCQLAHV